MSQSWKDILFTFVFTRDWGACDSPLGDGMDVFAFISQDFVMKDREEGIFE